MVFCLTRCAGDCNQLLRPAYASNRNRLDTAQYPNLRTAIFVVTDCVSFVVRRLVRNWRTFARLDGHAQRLPADYVVVVARLCAEQPGDRIRVAFSCALSVGDWRRRCVPCCYSCCG